MKASTRRSSTDSCNRPAFFSADSTMKPSAWSTYCGRFSAVIPEPRYRRSTILPHSNGIPQVGEAPVALPVTITASARMNSMVAAISPMLTSAVMACAECFFFTSAQTATPSAPICRRYRRIDRGLDDTLIGDVTVGKALHANEVELRGKGDGDRFVIRPG